MVKRLEGKLASLANIHCARNLEQKTAALQSGAVRGTQQRHAMPGVGGQVLRKYLAAKNIPPPKIPKNMAAPKRPT